MVDPKADTFALPASLIVPIAAKSLEAVEKYVGKIVQTIVARAGDAKGRVNAMLIDPYTRAGAVHKENAVMLWKEARAAEYEERLYPDKQVWAHVQFGGYRDAYVKLGMPSPDDLFLDHIQNREAIRKRGNDVASYESEFTHPYLRLCPVRRKVNTSGGHKYGIEGREKQWLDYLKTIPAEDLPPTLFQNDIVYADPTDLTKMLDEQPGTIYLDDDEERISLLGVRKMQVLFYPS